jgi:ABC-type proline/glycine betaine transport system permease subunit
LLYAAGAGTVAVVIGFLLAGCVGRNDRLRTFVVGIVMALFSLPPALTALGLVQLAAAAPAWADPFLRSRFTVCVALGLRFSPVAAVFAFVWKLPHPLGQAPRRAWGLLSTYLAGYVPVLRLATMVALLRCG